MKTCTKCKEKKSIAAFSKNKARADNLQNICKPCSRARSKQYYRDNKAKHKAKAAIRRDAERVKAQLFVAAYLDTNNCVDCGETNMLMLEFDHVDRSTKKYGISCLIQSGYPIATIEAEISKCEVRCANCHNAKTHRETNNHRWRFVVGKRST